jgi:hypothetical protein
MSLAKTRWKVCLKSAVLKESPIIMWPLSILLGWYHACMQAAIPSKVGAEAHLQQPRLIKSTGVNINDVSVIGGSFGKLLVELSNEHVGLHSDSCLSPYILWRFS